MAKKPSGGQVLAAFQELSTCNISDALDRMGLVGQITGVLPLWHGCPKIAGPAMTMKLSPEAKHSTVMGTLEAIQDSRAGEVLVIDNGGRAGSNSFGGIATFSAKHYNMQGCVIDGATRDVDEMAALHFPVFGKGVVNTSVRGRIGFEGYDIPVKLGEVEVKPGHFVFADQNGVVVVPPEAIAEALRWGRRLGEMEQRIKRDIASGVRPTTAHRRHHYEEAARQDTS